jgi:hypothetical protein
VRSALAACSAVALATAAIAHPPVVHAGEGVCARLGPVEATGSVADPGLTEISGLARSIRHVGVLWTHNDSGGDPALSAMAEDGADLGTFAVEGAAATDWEDLASGPGPDAGTSYLYAADIGDNDAERPSVTVYRVVEPAAAPSGEDGTLRGATALELRYPDGAADAEALLVDPVTGDLVIVTKSFSGNAQILRAPAAALDGGDPMVLVTEGELSLGLLAAVTGGDVSPDGSIVLLRTYASVLAFPRPDGGSLVDALLGEACAAPQAQEPQGEAVAFTRAGDAYVTVSEGTHPPVHRVAIEPAETPTSTTTAPGTTVPSPAAAAEPSTRAAPLIVAALAVAVLAGGAVLLRQGLRRRSGP